MIKRKTAVIVTAFVLLLGCFVGGTVAYLISSTGTITNTFTVGNVDIDLTEHIGSANGTLVSAGGSQALKGVPGSELFKDPTVTVKANSEKCYLFVKIVVANNKVGSTDIINYTLNTTGWTALSGVENVYYRIQDATSTDVSYGLITNNSVTINSELTHEQVSSISTKPTMTFKAAAVQFDNVTDVNAAWNLVKSDF